MKYGDIYWVDLPDRGGREQRGKRPSIVWQDVGAFPRLPTILVIPLTSQLDTLRFPGTLLIQPSAENGLATPSVALVFQLGACDLRRIGKRLGALGPEDLVRVREVAIRLQQLT